MLLSAALTSFAAWFGGRQAFGSPSPAQVSAALANKDAIPIEDKGRPIT